MSQFRIFTLLVCVLWAASAYADSSIFSIGSKNNSFTEFSRNHKVEDGVAYRVGKSSASRDWPAYEPGSLDSLMHSSTMQQDWLNIKPSPAPQPFQILFSLNSLPKGTFILHLDAIFRYRHPAAPRYALLINGKAAGSYQLNPHPAPNLWWPNGGEANGNTQYFGYESLDMPLPASFFTTGVNTLSIQCLDGFGIYYDDLSLINKPDVSPEKIVEASIEPTVLYKNRPEGLVELAKLHVRSTQSLGAVKLKVVFGTKAIESAATQNEFGDLETTVEVPAVEKPLPVVLFLSGSDEPIYRGTFVPKRRWNVYALPMEQADFGYNDLPARTLEWENRFIDKAQQIQNKYPSYSFTLDAAANLESYLETRADENGDQLLHHLRDGKWGINALYANFFTGLSTPEELFHTLDFSLRAGKQYGFAIDSASQTDEPSLTWALPQVLADAGIKYFTNGSDPIRGALNPIGLLNFHSPFYWESPTGSKVLMWSGVSYTAVDDLTWDGWNAEALQSGTYAPSISGLAHSLPLFLSQYERDDFPFDAVLLFGLHNDEIPLRHWGAADVIDMWNQEYAYPKVIPAPQRDFFNHITSAFGNQIKTYRGDGGAYWEDEAGSDARITSMIRASQEQIATAEKFESIASWLQPQLKFDRSSFDGAWKNILLADSYVWSDANSFRRPESYRTRGGEATHRAWAEAAFQQSSDLKLIAMDKVAELVGSSQQGTVVFNAESWPRSDFFDFELEADEILIDTATGQAVPCGSMKQLNGYQEVRCWAANVPATGYKFYAIAKGTTSRGKTLELGPASTVENKYYKLQIDPKTGAISHLIDKSTMLDLVDSGSNYKLNEYIYVTGGDPGTFFPQSIKDNRILAADITLPLPKLTVNHPSLTKPPRACHFPWGIVLTIHSTAINTPEIISTITLLDTQKQINIENDIQKAATLRKEGVYFAFPFAAKQPQLKYQGATAWVDPETDMLPGANRQWFTTQGGIFVDGTENKIAFATVDSPLVTFQDINRGLWPESIHIQNGTVLSYVMNNYWYTDAPAQQGGNFSFHYALTSDSDVSTANAMMLSAEQRSPLTAIRHYSMGWQPMLSDKGGEFLSTSPSGVKVLTIRPLANSDDYLVRVQNTTSDKITAAVSFSGVGIKEAHLGSVLGELAAMLPLTSNTVQIPLGRYEIKTLVVHLLDQSVKDQAKH